MRNGLKLIKFVKNPTMLDDAPWEWGSTGGWCNGMPEFFQGMPNGVYDNIYDDLDDSPITWHITEPVDPTEYQNEWLGDVVSAPLQLDFFLHALVVEIFGDIAAPDVLLICFWLCRSTSTKQDCQIPWLPRAK